MVRGQQRAERASLRSDLPASRVRDRQGEAHPRMRLGFRASARWWMARASLRPSRPRWLDAKGRRRHARAGEPVCSPEGTRCDRVCSERHVNRMAACRKDPRSDIPAHHRADEPELLPITLWAPNLRRSRRRLGEAAFGLNWAPSCRGCFPPQCFRAGGEIASEHDVGTSKSRSRDKACRPPELAADRRNRRRRGYRCRIMITRAGGSAHPREATDLGLSKRVNDCGTQSART